MSRLIIRTVVIGVVFGIGWIIYQLSDFTDCSGPRAEAWFESSILLIDDSIRDFDSISPSTTLSDFSNLASNAKSRYEKQQNIHTPGCLSEVQDNVIDEYYFEWKAYDHASEGDFDLADGYIQKSNDSRELSMLEFDKLARKHNWDLGE